MYLSGDMAPYSRTYPAFPIPAVGAVILNQDHVVLVQRGQAPAQGQWTLPGGVVELGEAPEEAILREVCEECHLKIAVLGIIDVVNRVLRDEQQAIQYHYVIIDYLARCQEESLLPTTPLQPGTDVTDVRWVPFSEIVQYDLTEGLIPIIRAGIAMQAEWEQY